MNASENLRHAIQEPAKYEKVLTQNGVTKNSDDERNGKMIMAQKVNFSGCYSTM